VIIWSRGKGISLFSKNASVKSYGGSSNGGNGERYGIVRVGGEFCEDQPWVSEVGHFTGQEIPRIGRVYLNGTIGKPICLAFQL
jgi:hypothetical protein